MAIIPQSTKDSLELRLLHLIRAAWPQLRTITLNFKTPLAYVSGITTEGEDLPLCRLRYIGYASEWGFAIYRASHDDYADTYSRTAQPREPRKMLSTPPVTTIAA